ncbi:barstar family protein [Neorhizobium sp. JUb45]|uniref:barstar family protein n=1 Tax=Neorhizobium sp. JUb45 TaxID=2485113 RepID=UPI0010D8635B|nr:barstar family protein [Neorhizobium sp. JUb45]TCQ99299.1 RNAse (barnase) inhibitor barstar [Neorhizobium sp. JUb45]
MKMSIDGTEIRELGDFYQQFYDLIDVNPKQGRNLNALWDHMSGSVDRPLHLVWVNSENSKKNLGPEFEKLIEVFERTRAQDIAWGLEEKFTYELE